MQQNVMPELDKKSLTEQDIRTKFITPAITAGNNLYKQVWVGFLQLFIALAVLLFFSAWTFDYWQAWIFLVVYSLSVLTVTLDLMKRYPKLLERRMNAKPGSESRRTQKIANFLISKALFLVVVVSAIDHRCAGAAVPLYGVVAGDVLVVIGFLIGFFVFRENAFASAIIETGTGQKVISSGPYALVRHPMYLGWLVTFSGVAPALGSWWGLFTLIPILLVVVWRLLDEEIFLAGNLPGYSEYQTRVPYRLVPFIW
jgi:protein-S-isoprenylcysteine O-methyltransferase Ste14